MFVKGYACNPPPPLSHVVKASFVLASELRQLRRSAVGNLGRGLGVTGFAYSATGLAFSVSVFN